MALPSVMEHRFSQIPQNPLQRSSFDRSYGHKTTMSSGYLVPVCLQEILPGDTINMDATFFGRIATLIYPIMDNVFLDSFWFFVPNRLVWDNWQKFNGERLDPDTNIDVEIPYINNGGGGNYQFQSFSLADYFGLPVGVNVNPTYTRISALPFRMYGLIYNEWFRDQNLQDSIVVSTGDGPDANGAIAMMRRGKRHDYFTSCLPWPQKGDAIAVPLGTTAPVIGNGDTLGLWNGTVQGGLRYNASTGINGMVQFTDGNEGDPAGSSPGGIAPTGTLTLGLSEIAANSGVIADLSSATAATINQLREAFAIQQLLEMNARGGTRYVEQIRSMWGVQVEDYRLQRPEYLGGSSQRIDVRQVAQTTPVSGTPDDQNVKASLAGYGQIGTRSGFMKSFVEHGYIMCLVNVRADITYQQGIERHWTRSSRYDFYQPPLAHLGEQPVYLRELYYAAAESDDTPTVFGYQERWAEYRYGRSYVSGAMRSIWPQSLDAWHLALDFSVPPQLDNAFIQDQPPISRVVAVPDDGGDPPETFEYKEIILDCYFKFRHARLMPVYSVPGLQRL